MHKLAFLLLAALPLAVAAIEVDGVAAKVGEDTILRSDVMEEMRRRNLMNPAAFDSVRNDLIERRLILRASSESKMTMQEWVVDNRVREIINRGFSGDRNKLIASLAEQKVSFPEWRAKIKEDMIVGAMRWNVVDKNTTASPAAMRKEYEENKAKYASEHRVSVSVIMLKPDEVGRRAEISEGIKTSSFEAFGGKLYENVIPEEVFNADVCQEISKMPKGTVSHWIEIDGWSFLIRKESESIGKQMTFAEAYDKIEENVKEADAKRLYDAWIERLKAETYIKVF